MICIANIEEVVKVIKTSPSSTAASKTLQARFLLDEEQAKAVLDMKLSRLANLEVQKLVDEREKLLDEADRIHKILTDEDLFNQELRTYDVKVEEGIFGAHMKLDFLNDGPCTILYEF